MTDQATETRMAAMSSQDAPEAKTHTGTAQFLREVFPAELREIRRRRRQAGDTRELPATAPSDEPSTDLDLVGLAFSGGGIRSASFSLGVTQNLLKTGLFYRADYLSTVSGGGYTGSCLSTLMREGRGGERLLIEPKGAGEPPALNHLRNNSNYLAPQGLLNRLRMPALMMTGAAYTMLLIVPLVIAAVFLTEVIFEATGPLGLGLSRPFGIAVPRAAIPLVGLAPLVLATVIRPVWAFLRRNPFDWSRRDQRDRRLGLYLLAALASLVAVPVLKGLESIVEKSAGALLTEMGEGLGQQWQAGFRGWLVWVAAAAALVAVLGLVRDRRRFLVLSFAFLGPLMVVSLYVVLCVHAINSPFVARCEGGSTKGACAIEWLYESPTTAPLERQQPNELGPILESKNLDVMDYRVCWDKSYSDRVGGWLDSQTRSGLVLRRRDVAWIDDDGAPASDVCAASKPTLRARLRSYLGTTQMPNLTLVAVETPATGSQKGDRILSIPELSLLRRGRAEWWVYLVGLLLALFNRSFININRISLHPFYRDRLSRTFLFSPNGEELEAADLTRLSELGGPNSAAPYHLVNTALNLQGSHDPQLRQRKTVPFVFAKCFSGGDYCSYAETAQLEKLDPHINLGTAMAISAAAAAPNTGAKSIGPVSLLLALLNFRLNYWVPHPRNAGTGSGQRIYDATPGVSELLREALDAADDPSSDPSRRGKPPKFLNCSDGGHLENLAVIELLRRRCRVIICVDGEADSDFNFKGLVTLQRYAEIDFDASIDIKVNSIRARKDGLSKTHFAIGTIRYGARGQGDEPEQGVFIYLKLSVTGDEPEYLRFYRKTTPRFPHESTGDQFFDETKFEVYRALGEHVAEVAFAHPEVEDLFKEE